jgi:hypothetical protein
VWTPRAGSYGGVVPRWVWVSVALVVAAGVAVFEVGVRDAHARRIPAVISARIAEQVRSNPAAWRRASVGRAEATRLATALNGLPQAPSGDTSCPDIGNYVINFTTAERAIVEVEIGECSAVDARSGGPWWGWNKYDRDGTVLTAIGKDLARR